MFAGMEKKKRPERVIQFGEGGFLRGFCDWMMQIVNEDGSTENRFIYEFWEMTSNQNTYNKRQSL